MKSFTFVVLATLCFSSEIHRASSNQDKKGKFSSLLATAGEATTPIGLPFSINGPNGFCANETEWDFLQLGNCDPTEPSQLFILYDDGTIHSDVLCLTARGSIKGSPVETGICDNKDKKQITWRANHNDRQIIHSATGLVLSAISGGHRTSITLEENVFSSYQTWRLDYDARVRTARIIGLRRLCLLWLPQNEVWLGNCRIGHLWSIYPDGTIRPEDRSNYGCLSSTMASHTKVFVSTCGLEPSAERWVLTDKKALLNEKTGLVLDVYNSDPSVKNVQIHPFHGKENQQWTIAYE